MPEIPEKMVVKSELEKLLIFKSLKEMKIPITVFVEGISYNGVVEKYDENSIVVLLDSPVIGESGECGVNFVFNNNYHYFTSNFQVVDENKVLIFIPEEIKKNIVRKYKRIYVEGKVFMKFKILVQSQASKFKDSSIMDERFIFQEVRKPKPAIDKMLVSIKNLVSEFSQKIQIKIYKPEDKMDFVDGILNDMKKIFLIYNSYEDSITERRFIDESIVTVADVYRYYINKGEPRKNIESKLLDFLQSRRNMRIFSECYVPMMLEDEVVGYIRLVNDFDYHRSIKPINAQKVKEYADVLVEALVKYDYFRLDSGDKFDIPVINISAGGLLFRLNNDKVKKYLTKNTVLMASIKFPDRQIGIKGVITRFNPYTSEYALKFLEIEKDDVDYIESLDKKDGYSIV